MSFDKIRIIAVAVVGLMTACSASMSSNAGKAGTPGGMAGSGGSGPTALPPKLEPGTCGLDQPAFCEKFDTPQPGGRGGDLDESVWSFARWGHMTQYLWARKAASTYPTHLFPATFCGQPFSGILPGDDVRICDGKGVDGVVSHQLNEVFDDQGDFGYNSMRVRQPFDFTGRTGKVVWDVDAKVNPLNEGHGWWFEMWITEDPAPMPYHEAPTVTALPRKGFGLAFRFGADCPEDLTQWQNALETTNVTDDYKFLHAYPFYQLQQATARCFKVTDAHLNHFELRISTSQAELWASDADDPTSLQLRVTMPNLDLTFSRGYVHFQHAHYNAIKDGLPGCNSGTGDLTKCPTASQTFRWDNIGFDGPTYPVPRAYEIQEDHKPSGDPSGQGVLIGWYIDDKMPHAFTFTDVNLADALSASFNFNVMMEQGGELDYRFNGGAWHTFIVPQRPGSYAGLSLRAFTVDAPLAELVAGNNTVEVKAPSSALAGVGNMDLTVEVPR